MCHTQINTNLVTQAAQMKTYGIPNDTFQNSSALTVIIAMPLVQRFLYSGLRKFNISFPPISRIAVGFLLQGMALGYAAIVQKVIYSAGPCYNMPLKCSVDGNEVTSPNDVNIALQLPAYVFDGLAGIFYYPTGQEYAYTKAPTTMKALVQSILMFTVALGSALAFAFSPLYKDPINVIMYACMAGLILVTTFIFYLMLRKYDKKEAEMNNIALENSGRTSNLENASRSQLSESGEE
jgi:POT family proton-dependent oligopeptide transporter